MKKLNILKTFAISIVVISLLCAFCFPINAVNALTNYTENKENRSIETLTITADQGLGGDMGYVTCKVIVMVLCSLIINGQKAVKFIYNIL